MTPKFLIGRRTAYYANSTHLNSDVIVGSEWNGAQAFFTPLEQSGTPFDAVTSINYVEITNGNLHFTVKGSGFVNGHVLAVAFLLIKS